MIEGRDHYLNDKIRTTNLVSYGLLGVATFYAVFSQFYYPSLTYLPVVGFVFVLIGMLLGFLEQPNWYRLIISLAPTFIAITYHRGLLAAGSTPLSSLLLLQGAFSLLPFMIFDLREKRYLIISGVICFSGVVFFRATEGWLEYGLDDSLFREGNMHELTVIFAMLFIYGSVLIFSSINLKSEKESEKLLQESRRKNQELDEQQAKAANNIARLEAAQAEERKRAWASEGFSQFGALMRKSDELSKIYDELLAGIVKYVEANQAVLFLVEEDKKEVSLNLKSCYAFNRKKYREQKLMPGEGLAGQVYLEKDLLYFKQIPQGYPSITSGLGGATPAALLIIPLLNNEKVEGVLELASFQNFEQHVIDFLMQLGKDLAASIGMNRINEMTKVLLEESQENTESMRAQEEELRQNMEELSATQEEMHRKERELTSQLEAVNNALISIEFDKSGSVLTANKNFLKATGYELEEIKGKQHSLFVNSEDKASAASRELWPQLILGNVQAGAFKLRSKAGIEECLPATYAPVKNRQGEVWKVIFFAHDFNYQKQQIFDFEEQS